MSSVSRQFGSSSTVKRNAMPDWELIWENDDPTASFTAQIVSLNLAKYGWVKVEAVLQGSGENYVGITMDAPVETEDDHQEQMLQMVNRMKTDIASGEMYEYSRCFHVTETGITFQACSRRRLNTTDASANSTQNAKVVPTRIWGKTTASSAGGDASFRDSGAGMRLLWTNPDTSADFAEQTINLDLSDYDAVWVAMGATGDNYYCDGIVLMGTTYTFRIASNSGANTRIFFRPATANASGVVFGDCTRFTQGTSGATVVTNAMKPKYIYGVKFG